jgi:hypothetical protein
MKCNDVFSVFSSSLPWCRVMKRKEKVSLAWVALDAAERYVAGETGTGGKVRQHGTR